MSDFPLWITLQPVDNFARWVEGGLVCNLFFVFSFVYRVYDRVCCMTPLQVELANVEWEIFLIYKSGFVAPKKLAWLWAEVDRLDALVLLDG